MKRLGLALIAVNLVGLVALAIAYPAQMLSPGRLVPAHADLANDCSACHVPFRGPAVDRCVACHALADIGLRTTRQIKTAFHQELVEQDCMTCHTDHPGSRFTGRSGKSFSHALLRATTRDRCEVCHAAPETSLHQGLGKGCAQCHTSDHWKPATFKHALLAPAVRERCEACHQAPTTNLHRQFKSGCGQCHTMERWKPATFDHARYFALDGDHDAPCATCHPGDDYRRYTCYGCHEHTPSRVRAEHLEEGIRDFENCAACHRGGGEGREGD